MANRKFLVAESGPDGTAGAPTYSFSSSTTTGLYYVATGGLGLATNAGSRLTINSAGNVTIANPTSGTALTISGGGASITGTLNMNTNTVTGVASPVAGSDAVNLTYLTANAVATGTFDWKTSVRAASTANITISPGGTTLTVDGVVLVNNDRVLLKNQTTGSENGIYVVSGIGASVVLTRATDTDATGEMTLGTNVYVQSGTINANVGWAITATTNADGKTITVGTDTPTFSSTIRNTGNVGFNGKTPVAPADYTNVAYVPLNATFASSGQGVVLTTVTTFPGAGGGLTLVAGSGIPLNPTWGIDKETNPDYITLNQLASRVKTIVNQLQAVGIFV